MMKHTWLAVTCVVLCCGCLSLGQSGVVRTATDPNGNQTPENVTKGGEPRNHDSGSVGTTRAAPTRGGEVPGAMPVPSGPRGGIPAWVGALLVLFMLVIAIMSLRKTYAGEPEILELVDSSDYLANRSRSWGTLCALNELVMYVGPFSLFMSGLMVNGGISIAVMVAMALCFFSGLTARRFLHPFRLTGKVPTIVMQILVLLIVGFIVAYHESSIQRLTASGRGGGDPFSIRMVPVFLPAIILVTVLVTLITVIRSPQVGKARTK